MCLKIENLTTNYQNQNVLNNISFIARASEVTVLMGTSGSGKTTLLLSVLGICKPQSGKILLNNKEITHLPIEERHIGYLPQDYGLFPHMTVENNVAFGLKIRGIDKKERLQQALNMLALVNLKEFGKRKIKELSGGQKQRVGLARSLAIQPELLLLDEPLSNVDQITKFEVATQLKILFGKIKIPIILVTHSHEDALFLADSLVILINGKIAQMGCVDEVFRYPAHDDIRKILRPFPMSRTLR